MLKIVLMSDTHGRHHQWEVPPGDILLHAGDCTDHGRLTEVKNFNDYLGELPHRHKIVIAGNHDRCFESHSHEARALLTHAHYLQDSSITIEGIRIYGSPWQPEFRAMAFNLPRGEPLAEKWRAIPNDADIVMTHGPPRGILDQTKTGEWVGCADLLARLQVIRPRLHVFGHIHEAAGSHREQDTLFVNASLFHGQPRPLVLLWNDGILQ